MQRTGVVLTSWGIFGLLSLFAQLPASSNYKLDSYGIGSGGTPDSSSSTYRLEGISGEQSGGQSASSSFKVGPGFIFSEQANVPAAPTFTNPANYYNKLHFVIDTGSNPSDSLFAIAISDDDFVTTRYIQNDNAVGSTLGLEDYQTYADWGSGTGEDVVGLTPNTTYKIKVKAISGDFTESGYGSAASASTVNSTLSFSITTDSQGSPPFSISLGNLSGGVVSTSSDHINVVFATNGSNGGNVYVYDSNSGLDSASAGDTIASATADLSSAPSGYGPRSTSATQSSGGPFTALSPYNGAGDNVGVVDTVIRIIYNSSGPVVSGSGSFVLKAKPTVLNKAAGDYADTITLIAAGQF